MELPSGQPQTLTEAIRHFGDPQICINTVALMRWEDGSPVCVHCGATQERRNHYWLATQKRWKCYQCRKQFSVKRGTIFEDSALSLDVWLIALWMLCNCKNGVSSYEIARATGIAQKSAWFVLQRLRHTLGPDKTQMLEGGPVEIDETFIGPRPKNMHAKRRAKLNLALDGRSYQTPVMGMLDRGTREVRAMVIPNVSREVLLGQILDNVDKGSTVYTDGWQGYVRMDATRYVHETVNHANEYVRGSVHTQAIENFWSCLKRTLKGTYIAVEAFHLDLYLNEQMFRFNNRINDTDGTRFQKALAQADGKRLTWVELTGKESKKVA